MYPALHYHPLQHRHLPHKQPVFVVFGEPHHPLHARAVVPRAVEQHDLPRGREVAYVALKIPLPALHVRRLIQRHHMRRARVPMLHKARDCAALARRIPPLEQDYQPLPRLLHPVLQLDHLNLQRHLLRVVFAVAHPRGIRKQVFPEKPHAVSLRDVQRIVKRLRIRNYRARLARRRRRDRRLAAVGCVSLSAPVFRCDVFRRDVFRYDFLLYHNSPQRVQPCERIF